MVELPQVKIFQIKTEEILEVALNNADSAVLLAGSLSHREVMKSSIQVDGLEKVVWSIAG